MIICNSLFDRDHIMFCKSGILIFIYAENNYLIYAHTLLIKTPLLHQSLGPRVFLSFFLFFLSFSLSLYFWLIPWSSEAHWAHFLARASKTLLRSNCAFTHSRGRLVPTCSSASPKNRTLLAFRINQGYQPPSLSYFLISDSGPPGSSPLKDQHRGSSKPRDRSQISHIAGRFSTSWATSEAQEYWSG